MGKRRVRGVEDFHTPRGALRKHTREARRPKTVGRRGSVQKELFGRREPFLSEVVVEVQFGMKALVGQYIVGHVCAPTARSHERKRIARCVFANAEGRLSMHVEALSGVPVGAGLGSVDARIALHVVEAPRTAAVVGVEVNEVAVGLVEGGELGVEPLALVVEAKVGVPKLLCAKIGIADFKPPCAEVRPEGKALFELGATGSVRHSGLHTKWFADGVGIAQQGGVSCKGPNLAAKARGTRVATFFDIVVRKECRLKLFHIRVEPFVRVLVVAQYAELLVRPKRQMPVAEAAVQGRRLRSRVQVERNVCVVFVTGLGFFALVHLVVFGAERRLKARHRP